MAAAKVLLRYVSLRLGCVMSMRQKLLPHSTRTAKTDAAQGILNGLLHVQALAQQFGIRYIQGAISATVWPTLNCV